MMEEFFIKNFDLEGVIPEFFAIYAVVVIILLIYILIIYIFQGIALMNLAQKNNVPNAWLAFIPVANMYLLGKLGFEIYAPKEKRNEKFTWILFGVAASNLVIQDSDLTTIINAALIVFSTWSYYYIFAKINPENKVLFVVLNVIFSIGGLLLFFNRNNFTNENPNETVSDNLNNEKKSNVHFCSNCGNKLNENSKFCSKCGNKI